MGFLDAGYALFEFTGQKILDFYDILSSAPAIVKIFQNNSTKKNRRKEKGLAGKFLTPKRGIVKNKPKSSIKSKDSHILVTPRTPKLSLAITPSLKRSSSSTSAPITIPTVTPTPAPEKIQKLESELTKLREEIAKLMSNPKGAQQGGVSGTVSFPSQPYVPQSFVPSHTVSSPSASTPSVLAPPPPPPPLPTPDELNSTPKLYRSASSITATNTNTDTPKKETMPRTMSLADVLKGASAANLRKTDLSRSPGGTPTDGSKSLQKPMNDPQDFIAQALKKKFASINRYNTPETTQKRKQVDGDSGWDESPPPSPGRTRKAPYTPVAFVQDENVPPVENVANA